MGLMNADWDYAADDEGTDGVTALNPGATSPSSDVEVSQAEPANQAVAVTTPALDGVTKAIASIDEAFGFNDVWTAPVIGDSPGMTALKEAQATQTGEAPPETKPNAAPDFFGDIKKFITKPFDGMDKKEKDRFVSQSYLLGGSMVLQALGAMVAQSGKKAEAERAHSLKEREIALLEQKNGQGAANMASGAGALGAVTPRRRPGYVDLPRKQLTFGA